MTSDPRIACLCFLLGLLAEPASAQTVVGGGIAVMPAYPGAENYRVLPVPALRYENGPFFISSMQGLPGLGLKTTIAPDLTVGAMLGFNLGRPEDRSAHLAGLGDIDSYGQYGAFAEWTPGRFSTSLNVLQATGGNGTTIGLRASYSVWQGRQQDVRIGAGAEWGNSKNMQTWFGITPEQAANSAAHLPAYQISSGLRSLSATVAWNYRFNARWGISTMLGVQTLPGDAGDSPIVERRTAAFSSVVMTYAF